MGYVMRNARVRDPKDAVVDSSRAINDFHTRSVANGNNRIRFRLLVDGQHSFSQETDVQNVQGGPKTALFLTVDNFATRGRKACDM